MVMHIPESELSSKRLFFQWFPQHELWNGEEEETYSSCLVESCYGQKNCFKNQGNYPCGFFSLSQLWVMFTLFICNTETHFLIKDWNDCNLLWIYLPDPDTLVLESLTTASVMFNILPLHSSSPPHCQESCVIQRASHSSDVSFNDDNLSCDYKETGSHWAETELEEGESKLSMSKQVYNICSYINHLHLTISFYILHTVL